ncbi:60S ribosomal protein L15 [Tanacetum coccineum]
MVEKTKGGARKEDVVTREYTINVHKPLHGWLCVGGQDVSSMTADGNLNYICELNGKSLINAANMKKYMCVATHQRNELKGSWVAFRSSILTVLMRFLPTSTLRYSDMRGKGHPNHKQRPSRRAAWKRNNTLSLRRYR